jgi:hypothetical protein
MTSTVTVDENLSPDQGRSGASDPTGTGAEFPVASAQTSSSVLAGLRERYHLKLEIQLNSKAVQAGGMYPIISRHHIFVR